MKIDACIILTVDYELFGNGSGNPDCCILSPAEKIIATADFFNAPVTFFVEALEMIAFENNSKTSAEVGRIRKQILKAIAGGHDAQLHLHPQWYTAESKEPQGWVVDETRWRIGDLYEPEIDKLITDGKKWLENLIRDIRPEYRCTSFRAGGWCIQPSEKVLNALTHHNFKVDSTVAPGMKIDSKGEWFNFYVTPKKPFWMTTSDVCLEDEKGTIAEVPITTGKISPLSHFLAKKAHQRQSRGFAPSCSGSYRKPNGIVSGLVEKMNKLFNLGNAMLDFSTMPADILIEITEKWIKAFGNLDFPIPIVAIAHTKNFTASSSAALKTYLTWATENNIKFSTYSNWYNNAIQ